MNISTDNHDDARSVAGELQFAQGKDLGGDLQRIVYGSDLFRLIDLELTFKVLLYM